MATVDEDRVRRIADLVGRIAQIPDPESRAAAHALMEAVLELHGVGLDRIMEIAYEAGETGKVIIRRLAGDALVSSLLVLHGLHPDDIETRVQHALGKTHGNAELLGVFEGAVRIRLTGSGSGLRDSVEAAVRDAVPDATEIIIVEGPASNGFVPLSALGIALPGIS